MKAYFFLTLIISSSFYSSVYSQKNTISLGPEIGILNEPLRNNEALGNTFHLGLNGGLHLTYSLTDNISFSLRSLVSTRKKTFFYETSYREEDRINDWVEAFGPMFGVDSSFIMIDTNSSYIKITTYNKYSGTHRQLFLDFPISASYRYKNFSVYGGFYVSLLLRNETVTELYSETPALDLFNTDSFPEYNLIIGLLFPNHKQTEVTYNVSKTNLITLDYGINIGFSYHVNQLYFYARYMMGFPDYRKENNGDNKYANHLIQSGIGYTFPFNKKTNITTPSIE